jgi:hypothetical protein
MSAIEGDTAPRRTAEETVSASEELAANWERQQESSAAKLPIPFVICEADPRVPIPFV